MKWWRRDFLNRINDGRSKQNKDTSFWNVNEFRVWGMQFPSYDCYLQPPFDVENYIRTIASGKRLQSLASAGGSFILIFDNYPRVIHQGIVWTFDMEFKLYVSSKSQWRESIGSRFSSMHFSHGIYQARKNYCKSLFYSNSPFLIPSLSEIRSSQELFFPPCPPHFLKSCLTCVSMHLLAITATQRESHRSNHVLSCRNHSAAAREAISTPPSSTVKSLSARLTSLENWMLWKPCE